MLARLSFAASRAGRRTHRAAGSRAVVVAVENALLGPAAGRRGVEIEHDLLGAARRVEERSTNSASIARRRATA